MGHAKPYNAGRIGDHDKYRMERCDKRQIRRPNEPPKSVIDQRKQDDRYATTSAALKLLLLRRTGRGPGR